LGADMLSTIQLMCTRFLNHQNPYALKWMPWGFEKIVYLPAMWMPYIFAELAKIDLRWVNTVALLLAMVFVLFTKKEKHFLKISLLGLIPIIGFLISILLIDTRILYLCEECLVFFYYAFLVYAIAKQHKYLIAIALTLCMFSRYALAGWAIIYVLYSFFYISKKNTSIIIAIGASLSIVLFYISNAIASIPFFLNLQSHYMQAILENKEKYSPQLQQTLGIAKCFGYQDLSILHYLFLACAFVIPIISFALIHTYKKHFNIELLLLISLKLSLIFFFNLIIMPYNYLFYTSTIVTMAIFNVAISIPYKLKPG
jgi:hypothetical protein